MASKERGRKRQARSEPAVSRSTVGATGPNAVNEPASSRTDWGTLVARSSISSAGSPTGLEWPPFSAGTRASPAALRESRSSHASDARERTAVTRSAPPAPCDPKGGSTIVASEIGRASCRERVEISVVAVSLKKKKKRCKSHWHE